MSSKNTGAAAPGGRSGGSAHVVRRAADDDREYRSAHLKSQYQCAAERALTEMMVNGAVLQILRREGRPPSFVYELPRGGDRQRCRAIIQNATERGGAFWAAFAQAIVENAEGPAR